MTILVTISQNPSPEPSVPLRNLRRLPPEEGHWKPVQMVAKHRQAGRQECERGRKRYQHNQYRADTQ